jgi:hypothetical protein
MAQKSAVLERLLFGPSTKDAEGGTAPGASNHDMRTVDAPAFTFASVSMSRQTESGFHAKRHSGCKLRSSSLPVLTERHNKVCGYVLCVWQPHAATLALLYFHISN